MNYYSLRSKSLEYFNQPFPAVDDVTALNMLRNSAMAGADIGLINNLSDLDLFKVGEFDSKKGFESCKPKFVYELSNIPKLIEMCEEVKNRGKDLSSVDS